MRKCHILKLEISSPNRDVNLHSSIGGRLGRQMSQPLHHVASSDCDFFFLTVLCVCSLFHSFIHSFIYLRLCPCNAGRIPLPESSNCCSFSFSFSSRWHCHARKGPYALCPVSQQSPQGCPRNSANICLVAPCFFTMASLQQCLESSN